MEKSIRDAYGEALVKYGAENENVVVLDADVSGSTKSALFGKAYPQRFFNVGIAEACMNAMACGLASAGKIPFTNTFATFMTSNGLLSMRALASYNKLNVKFAGGYGGLSDSYDGPTHHAIDDLAVTCALPNFTVAVASDAVQADYLVKAAIDREGPFYLRLSREAFPAQYQPGAKFALGKAMRLRAGRDVTIIACGIMVGRAVEAAERLALAGVDAGVVDMFTIKPLDGEAVLLAAQESGAVVVAEEHSRHGGLGAAVSQVLARHDTGVPVRFVALNDTHTESGAYNDILEKYGLGTAHIERACRSAVAAKPVAGM